MKTVGLVFPDNKKTVKQVEDKKTDTKQTEKPKS